jgi:rhamnosyl/mannosyltransferase
MNTSPITRITVVAAYFYPKIGGLENYAYLLAKNLQESGKYNVSVITSNYDGKGYRKEVISGMTVHRLPIWIKISNTPINPMWYWTIKKIFAAENPDIVHLHSPVPFMADVAARAAGKRKVVLTYHAGSMLKGKWLDDAIIGPYEKIFLPMLFERADAIVAVSQQFAKRTFPQYMNKIHFIAPGVDLGRFKRTPLPTKTETVLFVGRIELSSQWKGIAPLLRAMALVIKNRPQATLELVGGGDAIPQYQALAKELGIDASVKFLGPQLGKDLVDAYERVSMLVLPSTSDSEAFGTVLVEAMASGRPVIGTNIGGISQIIEQESTGLLISPGDSEALATSIERILANKNFAQKLADQGAIRSQDFSLEIQTRKYIDLFNTVLT